MRHPRRLLIRHLLAAIATVAAVAIAVSPAQPTSAQEMGAEMYLFAAVNQEREQNGLAPVTFRDDIQDVSLWHTARMAGEGRLYHNPERQAAVEDRVPDWQRIGENVGWSTSAAGLHARLMGSPTHRAVILGDYTQLAISVVHHDGKYWMTQLFIKAPSR
jgi:uncharacterized protein YkwD